MAGFLYFTSGGQKPMAREDLERFALGYAFDGTSAIENCAVNSNSPSGLPGNVFCDAKRHQRPAGHYPAEQSWRKLPAREGRPELWVGFWNDDKPTPGALERAQQLRGPMIKLADGQPWKIPIVRRFDEPTQRWESELPAYVDFDAQGKPVRGEPLAAYARLWDVTAPLADGKFAEESGETPAEDENEAAIWEVAVTLLQANYVVDLPELSVLKVLSNDDLAIILAVACRYKKLMGWLESLQKKSDQSEETGGIT